MLVTNLSRSAGLAFGTKPNDFEDVVLDCHRAILTYSCPLSHQTSLLQIRYFLTNFLTALSPMWHRSCVTTSETPGVDVFPGEGWPVLQMAGELTPMPVDVARNFSAPRTFHSLVCAQDNSWSVALLFRVVDGEVLFAGATAEGDELHVALRRVLQIKPLRWWQTEAFKTVLGHQLESDDENLYFAVEEADGSSEAFAALEAFRAERGKRPAVGRRRNRITPQLLDEVAQVYREAFDAGTAPTQAVGTHFGIPHSTAANWVTRARRDGQLGPADGTRGGEVAER